MRLGFCVALAGVGLAVQPAAARQPQWVQATPFGGPILDLEQATSSADTLYAVTDSGDLYVSTDGARTWSARSSPGNGELKYAIHGALVVDPRHVDTLYALTGWDAGSALLLRSVDGGRSWTNLDLAGPLTLTVDHENPLELWAGTVSGLYLSTDQGEHWMVVAFQNFPVDSFVIDPFDAQNFVLSLVDGSAWRSSDRGLTWQPFRVGLPTESSLLFDVVNPGVIYAFSSFGQTMRSRDGGRSWSTLPLRGVDDLASSPDGTLYAASNRAFFGALASHNLGSRWLPPPHHREFGGTEPADFLRRVIVSVGSPDTLFAAGLLGIWRSTDRGASWQASNEGVVNPTIDRVWADPSGRPGVFATAGGVFHSTDGGASWMLLANPFQCFADDACGLPDRLLASDPRAPQSMYGFGSGGQADYLAKSTDGGRNWSKLPFPITCCSGSQDALEMTAFYLDPRHPDTVFVGGYAFEIYGLRGPFLTRSDDGGRHWRELTPPTEQPLLGVVGGPPRTLYGLTCVGLFVSRDHGETWQTRGQGLPSQLCPNDDFGGQPLLLSDPQDPRTLYVGTPRQGIYRSVDGGSSFEPFGHGLETAAVGSLVVDPANPRRLYAGVTYPSGAIEPGIYGWNAVLDEWSPLNAGLPPYFTGIVTLEGTDPPALYIVAASGSVYRLPIP